MNNCHQRYNVSISSSLGSAEIIGQLTFIHQETQRPKFEFIYDNHYLELIGQKSIDPVALPFPIKQKAVKFESEYLPGFIDDFLPDAWGYKVVRSLQQLHGVSLNKLSDLILLSNKANIGGILIHPDNEKPILSLGAKYQDLKRIEHCAQLIDSGSQSIKLDTDTLTLIEQGFVGVGGARPKCLIEHDSIGYIAKFNRPTDPFNYARVELACNLMARAAGISVCENKVESDVNGRDVLLTKRFDVLSNGKRSHLISSNALLKNAVTFEDIGRRFKYDDIAGLINKYSVDPEDDLRQLLKLMLFNRAINNTDDHERNFSFIHNLESLRLAPAYDLVPTPLFGAYHSAGYLYSQNPLLPSQAIDKGPIFGIPQSEVNLIALNVIDTIKNWSEFANQAGLNEREVKDIKKFFKVS